MTKSPDTRRFTSTEYESAAVDRILCGDGLPTMGEESEYILSNVCWCGRPSTPGVLHRSDAPCVPMENLMNETPNPQTGAQGADDPIDNAPLRGDEQMDRPVNPESAWLLRLKVEMDELDKKGQALTTFIRENHQFAVLPKREQDLLKYQQQTMGTYFAILVERVMRAENPETAAEYDKKAAEAEKQANVGSGGTDANG